MDKFKELQEQHQVTPKEANPFLPQEDAVHELFELDANVGSETEPNSEVFLDGSPTDGGVEPEVIDNVESESQVKPDTAPTQDEGEE